MKTIRSAPFLMILLFSWSAAQPSKGGCSAQLKKSVAAVEFNDGRVVKGRIVAFRKGGILFDAGRTGPFYDPKPAFYPINEVQRFIDRSGRTLWKNPQAPAHKPTPKKISYKARVGLHGGTGQYVSAYSKPSSAESMQNMRQDIQTGGQLGVDAAMLFHRQFAFGARFTRHLSPIDYFGVTGMPVGTSVEDVGAVSTVAIQFSYLRPVTRRAMFHADLGLGQSTFANDGRFLPQPEAVRLSGFSASAGSGFDFFITRRFAVGFDLSVMLGSVSGEVGAEAVDFKQNLNRVDVNAGLRYYF